MPYSDFDLRKIRDELKIKIIEREHLFAAVAPVVIGPTLREILAENLPLARAINTEKARSELLIAQQFPLLHTSKILL